MSVLDDSWFYLPLDLPKQSESTHELIYQFSKSDFSGGSEEIYDKMKLMLIR